MKSYDEFLKENKDILEFPIKKYMSIIKDKIESKVQEGINTFSFDFSEERTLPIKFNLVIECNKGKHLYFAYVNKDEITHKYFTNFKLNVKVQDENIDYSHLYSIINHELKHVYDIFYDENTISINKATEYNKLKKKHRNKYILDFIELSNLALTHEIEARNRMIYDKLRWLKTFDKSQLIDEFKKTYVYKSLLMLRNFNSNSLINNVNLFTLIDFTNEFIKSFIKSERKVKDKKDLIKFYKEQEVIFKKISEEYMEKCDSIIDELIIDIKPYMENRLLGIYDNFYDPDNTGEEESVKIVIKQIWC